MAGYDGSIRIDTEIGVKNAEKELKSLESSISKTADKIASLRSKMDALKDAKLPTQEYQEISAQIEKAEQKFNKLLEKQEQMQREGKDSGVVWERLNNQIDEVGNEIRYAQGELQDLVETGKAFTLGAETEKYTQMSAEMQQLNQQMQSDTERQTELQSALAAEEQRLAEIKANATVSDQKIIDLLERRKQLMAEIADMERAGIGFGYKEYEDANRELEKINSQIKSYKDNVSKLPEQFKKMKDSAKKAFNAVSEGANESNKSLSSGLKTILKYGFGIRSLYVLFNKIRSGVKEGFSNFMNYSSDFANTVQGMKNAMSTLGNQFAAAFSPIVQLIIPWITKLINAISTAMTYVAQFIAILGGKSTFTRAKQVQDGYNKSLGGTAAAAKKAYGALAKFDDLDVLQKKDEDEAGGGMGDAVGDMFEEVPVDSKFKDWLDGILEKLKPILDYLKKLKDIFMEGFWDGLGDWEYRWEIIKDSIASIKDSLIDIFTDPAVLAAADEWAQSVAYMLGSLVGSIASIGLTIAANLLGGIAIYLEENKDRIKEYLVSMFDIWADVNYLLANFFQSFAYAFEAFASEQGRQLTANLIGIFANAFMGLTELASKIIRDILNIFIQPFVDNKEKFRAALEGFLGVLSDVAGTIKQGIDDTFDKLNEVYDAHFKPFFDSIAQGLSDLVGHFLEFWNGNVQPILDEWAALFDELWTAHIQPMINNFIELLGGLADMLKAFWENVLKPLVDWVIDNILPPVLTIIDGIVAAVMGFVGFLADIVSSIIDIIKGIVQFLTDIFKGDWEAAWNDIVELFDGSIFEKIKEAGAHFIEGIKEGIKEKWETLKEQIGNVAKSVVDKFKSVLGIHSPSTEMKEQGEYTIEGLIEGLESKAGYVSNIWTKLKEDTISILQSMADWISNFGFNISDSLTSALQGIQEYFTETWTSIYESTIETWTLIQEYFIEYWTLFIESLTETWEEILLLFTEKWEEIQLLFEDFILFLNEIFLVSWLETWTLAGEKYQEFYDLLAKLTKALQLLFKDFILYLSKIFFVSWMETWTLAGEKYQEFHDLLTELTKALQEMFTLFMEKIEELINTMWKESWKNAENIFTEFKDKVNELSDAVREIVQSLFDFVMNLVAEMLAAIASVGSAAAGISGGSFSGGGVGYSAAPAMASYSAQNFAAYTADLPHLASGSVIRGGNPFMAILGDQKVGQTNVEAPAGLIKDMVKQGISEAGIGQEAVPVTINLNWDGETFARLSISDILSELARQGYDVDVLGVV